MRKFLFTLLFIAGSLQFGFSQFVIDTLTTAKLDSNLAVFPYKSHQVNCADNIATIDDPNGGYISGSNSKKDKEKLQKFRMGKIGTIPEILVQFSKAVGGTDSVYGVLYDVNPITHGPGSIKYITDGIVVSDIKYDISHGFLTSFKFPSDQPVDDSFFVGFTLPKGTDTVACNSTEDGCFSGDLMVWETRSDDSFHPLKERWNKSVDLWIFPVLFEHPELGSTGKNLSGLTLNNAYPNPASDKVNVVYTIANTSNISLRIFDVLGQNIRTTALGKQPAGKHTETIDVKGLPVGNYFYQIVTESVGLYGKIVVE